MKSNSNVRVGIIGAGRIGKLHAEHLAFRIHNAELVAIADVDATAAQAAAKTCNAPQVCQDFHELLQNDTLQAVLICSSTDTHAKLIQEAAAAGKHIFCEKPIDLDLAKIQAALDAVDRAGVKLQIGFNRRFDPNFLKVKKLISAGKIGAPHLLRITSRDPEPPPVEYVRVSGGIFVDMTIHDFDMARYLMDSEVEEVFAVGNVLINPQFRDAGDIDTAVVTLKFANGAIGTIDNSRRAVYGYDQRVEVFGSEGMVQVGNIKPDRHVLLNAETVQSAKPLHFFLERYKDSFINEVQAFVDAIRNDTEPPVTGTDGLLPVKIGLAARKSFEENRPVKVQEVG